MRERVLRVWWTGRKQELRVECFVQRVEHRELAGRGGLDEHVELEMGAGHRGGLQESATPV